MVAYDEEPPRGHRVTVVIITRNRRVDLLQALDRSISLPEHPPIIVVDNASTDGTRAVVRRFFPEVKVISLDRNMAAAGRNIGVLEARTPYVAFCDDDSGWEPGSLRRAAALLDEHSGIGVLAGRLLVGQERLDDPINDEMRSSPLEHEAGLPGIPVLDFVACAAVARREAFLEAGGFEERFLVGGEEQLLALDLATLGWKLIYVEDITAYHLPSADRDLHERRRVMVRNALWTAWLRRRGAGIATGTTHALRGQGGDALSGALRALGGLPWVLKERRRVPPRVELARRRFEREGKRPHGGERHGGERSGGDSRAAS